MIFNQSSFREYLDSIQDEIDGQDDFIEYHSGRVSMTGTRMKILSRNVKMLRQRYGLPKRKRSISPTSAVNSRFNGVARTAAS